MELNSDRRVTAVPNITTGKPQTLHRSPVLSSACGYPLKIVMNGRRAGNLRSVRSALHIH